MTVDPQSDGGEFTVLREEGEETKRYDGNNYSFINTICLFLPKSCCMPHHGMVGI